MLPLKTIRVLVIINISNYEYCLCPWQCWADWKYFFSLPEWKNDPWYESHVELVEDEETIGKTENLPQPQWEHNFDLEIDNEKQVMTLNWKGTNLGIIWKPIHPDNFQPLPVQQQIEYNPIGRIMPVVWNLHHWSTKVRGNLSKIICYLRQNLWVFFLTYYIHAAAAERTLFQIYQWE